MGLYEKSDAEINLSLAEPRSNLSGNECDEGC